MSHPCPETISAVRSLLTDTFAAVDRWFERSDFVLRFRPTEGRWSIAQVLEHITLTNHYLLLTCKKQSEKAIRRASQGEPIPKGESDLSAIDIIGERGSFPWERPEHMEPVAEPDLAQTRIRMKEQWQECLLRLESLGNGEGKLCLVSMSVASLGKIDSYQWLAFLARHAQRHLQQMAEIEQEYAMR